MRSENITAKVLCDHMCLLQSIIVAAIVFNCALSVVAGRSASHPPTATANNMIVSTVS